MDIMRGLLFAACVLMVAQEVSATLSKSDRGKKKKSKKEEEVSVQK
jgi:hypothetical protein